MSKPNEREWPSCLSGFVTRNFVTFPLPGGVMVTLGILIPSFKVRILAG